MVSVRIRDGAGAGKPAVKWFVERSIELDGQLSEIEAQINQKCQEIAYAKNILEISGIGKTFSPGSFQK